MNCFRSVCVTFLNPTNWTRVLWKYLYVTSHVYGQFWPAKFEPQKQYNHNPEKGKTSKDATGETLVVGRPLYSASAAHGFAPMVDASMRLGQSVGVDNHPINMTTMLNANSREDFRVALRNAGLTSVSDDILTKGLFKDQPFDTLHQIL